MQSTITSKGQITIPKAIRDSMNLDTGDKIEFIVTEEGDALMRPLNKRVDDLFGRLQKPGQRKVSVEEMDRGIVKHLLRRNR